VSPMRFELLDFLVPVGVALAFLCLCWLYALGVRGGRLLTPFMRRTLVYGPLFVLGLGYLMMFAGNLHWPPTLLFLLIALWGAVVVLLAWWRCRRGSLGRESRQAPPSTGSEPGPE